MNVPATIRPTLRRPLELDELLLAPSLERRRLQCYLAQILTDCTVLLLGFCFFGYLYQGAEGLRSSLVGAQVLLPIFLTIALYNGAYSITSLDDPDLGVLKVLIALGISAAAVVFIAFLTKSSEDFSRVAFLGGVFCSLLLLVWSRLQMRSFVEWRCGPTVINELVIDDDGPDVNFPGAIQVSARDLNLVPDLNSPDALDRIGLALRNIDRVIVSCPPQRRAAWAMMLKGANIEGEVLDDQVAKLGAQGARVIGNHGTLLVSVGPLGLRARALKRLFDLAIASAAVLILLPVWIAVAVAIKFEDGGSIFFVQRRTGRGNCFFNMYKFRSMSESMQDSDGLVSASKQDKRLTRVGAFIRRTSIDELPQLFNVLLGDMSLVGPRPHAIGSQAGHKLFWEVDTRYSHRHSLKPGLSGLAQVRGYRGATDAESDLIDRLQSDLEYLEGWSILRDIKIIFLTLRVLVHDRAF